MVANANDYKTSFYDVNFWFHSYPLTHPCSWPEHPPRGVCSAWRQKLLPLFAAGLSPFAPYTGSFATFMVVGQEQEACLAVHGQAH